MEFPPPSDGFVFELGAERAFALFEQSCERKRRDFGLDLSKQTTVVVRPLRKIIEQRPTSTGQIIGCLAFLGMCLGEVLVMFFELCKRALKFRQKLRNGLVELREGFRSLQPSLGLEFAELLVHGDTQMSELKELLSLYLTELCGFVQGFASLKEALLCVVERVLQALVFFGQARIYRRRRKGSRASRRQRRFDFPGKRRVFFVDREIIFFVDGKSLFFVRESLSFIWRESLSVAWREKMGGRRGRCRWGGNTPELFGGREWCGRGA